MREHSHTTPRRRGPKHPLPQDALYNESYDSQESPYYTIDNTEDIYGTTLLPSQRCYVDPWDLENYDYVRKKIEQPLSPRPQDYYETSLSPSPIEEPVHSNYYYDRDQVELAPRMAATMPRNRRRSSHLPCQMECCNPQYQRPLRTSGLYEVGGVDKYDDYMTLHMAKKFQNALNLEDVERNIYTGLEGLSSSSSTEPRSSIGGDDYHTMTLQRKVSNYNARPQRRLPKTAPKLEFPSPPPMPPTYDYCNPYSTMPPCCSVSDCYECLSQAQQQQQQLYGSHSIYGTTSSCYGCAAGMKGGSQTLGRRSSSSLYSGIYNSKFGMSKKGLLQIDYSCSWNDLDRVMGRNY